MVEQKRRNTRCELGVRLALHNAGFRYRLDCRPHLDFRRRADIVFRQAKVAVFVDGCFWHGCPLHWKMPKRNASWWKNKIARNVARDADTTAFLEHQGWRVLRIWEHDDFLEAASRIGKAVQHRSRFNNRPPTKSSLLTTKHERQGGRATKKRVRPRLIAAAHP